MADCLKVGLMPKNARRKSFNLYAAAQKWLSLSACLFLLSSSIAPGFAQTAINEKQQLEQFEQIMFGQVHTGALADRLKALEATLFGKAKKGDMATRLTAIGDALGSNKQASASAAANENKQTASKDAEKQGAEAVQHGGVSLSEDKQAQVTSLLQQGMEQFNQGKLNDAESSFDEVLAIDPNNADAFFDLGVLKEKQGNFKAALADYKAAQDLKPDEKDIQDAVASLTQKLNDRQYHGHTQPASYETVPYTTPYTPDAVIPLPPPTMSASANVGCEKTKSKGSGMAKVVLGACAAAAIGVALSGAMHGAGGLDIGCPICKLLHGQ